MFYLLLLDKKKDTDDYLFRSSMFKTEAILKTSPFVPAGYTSHDLTLLWWCVNSL